MCVITNNKKRNKRTLFKVRTGGRKRMLVFTGDLDDICSITLVPGRDLKWAVAFCEDMDHAFECTARLFNGSVHDGGIL